MKRLRKHSPIVASILVAIAGVATLAQVLTVTVHHHRFGRIDDSLLPFTPDQSSHLFILSLGLLLVYLSVQIYRRKYLAYQLVSFGLAALIGADLFLSKNYVQLTFYIVTLGLLLLTPDEYTVTSDNNSLRRGAAVSGLIILVVFIYAAIGFSRLSVREVGQHIGVPGAMKYAAREMFTFQESQLPLRTRNARLFVASVDTATVVAYGLALVSLFRPLRFQYGASRHDRELARSILENSSSGTDDFFLLWPPDKHYYFSATHDSFVAYTVVGRDVLVLGGPTGNPATFKKLMQDFMSFSTRNDWAIAIVNGTEDLSAYLDANDYQRLFIGNEAVIDTSTFTETTARSKHFRYIRNRAERDSITFEYWPAPLTSEQITKLRRISNAWLNSRSRREYTFALGYFDAEYLKRCDVAVITRDNKLVAYANVVPSFVTTARTIDHMRYTTDMPPTGMHYLLMQLMLRLHEMGITSFNLGLAPLSGLEEREDSNIPERLLGTLKRLGSRYYSFGGLEQFKNKFEPMWQPRYIYYQGTQARLIKLTASLTRALTLPVAGRWRRTIIISLSAIAGIAYASFPLALLIDPDKAFYGFASELGASGNTYAGLFNGLDVLSSLLTFAIIWMLWQSLSSFTRRSKQVLILLGLSAAGTLLAAVTPLPTHIGGHVQLMLHDLFSFLNLLGVLCAAGLLTALSRYNRWLTSLFIILAGAIIITGVSSGNLLDSVSQRIQILLTGIWIVIIAAYFSTQRKLKK